MPKFSLARLRRLEFAVIVTALLFVAGMVVVSLFGDYRIIADAITGLDGHVLLVILALSLGNYLVRALRWHVFARHIGLAIPLRRNLAYYFAGFTMTTTPGKIGDLLRLWMLERGHGYHYHRTMPLIFGDRLADVNAALLLVLVSSVAFPDYWWISGLAFAASILATTAFAYPGAFMAVVNGLYHAVGRHRPRLFAMARRTLRFTARLFTWRLFVATVLLSACGWLAECTGFYIVCREFGIALPFLQAVFIFTFAMFVGSAAMLPGGLGGIEAVMIGLLVGLGHGFEVAVAATAVSRLTTLWFAVGLGYVILPWVLRRVRAALPVTTATAT